MFKGMDYVYEVYRERSFSKAAKNLFISQPSLSASIKKTETDLGFEIFDRSTKPIGLTEFGEAYIKSIESIMKIENNFSNYANDLSDFKAGSINIGGTNLFTSYILPPLISKFSKRYPNIHLNIVETNTAKLESRLYDGELDIVIDNYDFDESAYKKHFYAVDHIILAVPKAIAESKKIEKYRLSYADIINRKYLEDNIPTIPLDIFQDENFIFLKEGNDTRKRANRICEHEKFNPNVVLELDQQITAYNFACFGLGITFVSDILIRNVKKDNNIYFYKLNLKDGKREVAFYYKKFRYTKKATIEFLKMVDEWVEESK